MASATIPISSAMAPGAGFSEPGAQNPKSVVTQRTPGMPVDPMATWGVTEEQKNKLVAIIADKRSGWMQDRMERIRVWMLNLMFEKGIQWVGWDQTQECWFDALAEMRNNGLVEDGESVELERWMNNITLMFKQIFVGNLTRALPHSVVRPADADKPADTQTAASAQDLITILDRKNQQRKMIRTVYEYLFTFGCYFRYTRPVLDGVENGYDTEATFSDFEIQMPARMKCMRCGLETATAQLSQGNAMPPCPGCATPMGPESYYAAGEGNRISLQQTGVTRVPRASVRQTIHSPLEVDVDPNVKDWWQSEVLAFDREIGYGEALKLFPDFRDQLIPGQGAATTPNADWEKLMRIQMKSVTSGYASDLGLSRPTYSENWLNPTAFWEKGDKDFAGQMEQLFPDGVKVSFVGATVVDIRPATMRREWSSCRLYEAYGPYCPSIAERIVPFNQRFNAAMQMLDDWMQRSSTGLNVVAAERIDKQKLDKRPLVPGHIMEVPMRINGDRVGLEQVFAHYDLPMNPAAWNYPGMLLQFCQLIAGLPPQTAGVGTLPGVDTATGQEQMLGQATEALQPYWENVKDECARAAWNAILCAKKLMECGAMQKVSQSEDAKGAGWRNKQVSAARNGRRGRSLLRPGPGPARFARPVAADVYDHVPGTFAAEPGCHRVVQGPGESGYGALDHAARLGLARPLADHQDADGHSDSADQARGDGRRSEWQTGDAVADSPRQERRGLPHREGVPAPIHARRVRPALLRSRGLGPVEPVRRRARGYGCPDCRRTRPAADEGEPGWAAAGAAPGSGPAGHLEGGPDAGHADALPPRPVGHARPGPDQGHGVGPGLGRQ